MKILFDQQIFSFQEYGGISRYFYELAIHINKTKNKVLIDGKFSNNVYLNKLKKNNKRFLPRFNFPYKNVVLFYLNNIFDSKNLKKGNFDLLHVTYYHPYFLKYLKGKPYVVTVYDMAHELFSGEVKGLVDKTIKYKRETICGASKIIAISENTKKDLIRLYGIPENKIEVIYLGNPLEGAKPLKIDNLPDKYLLFVGNRKGYKNFNFFVKTVAPIIKNDKKLHLVCAGGGKFSREESKLLSELKISNQVKQIGFKNDNELAYIYKQALVYVLPSLYEGFGMTALEAFSMGCPVVASNTSSIPEVCGDAAIYVIPGDVKSIRDGIVKVLVDRELRSSLIKIAYKQARRFTWDKCINKTLSVYNNFDVLVSSLKFSN